MTRVRGVKDPGPTNPAPAALMGPTRRFILTFKACDYSELFAVCGSHRFIHPSYFPRAWAEKFGNKRSSRPTDDDIVVNPCAALVLFVGFAHCPAPLPPEVSASLWIEGKCRRELPKASGRSPSALCILTVLKPRGRKATVWGEVKC